MAVEQTLQDFGVCAASFVAQLSKPIQHGERPADEQLVIDRASALERYPSYRFLRQATPLRNPVGDGLIFLGVPSPL